MNRLHRTSKERVTVKILNEMLFARRWRGTLDALGRNSDPFWVYMKTLFFPYGKGLINTKFLTLQGVPDIRRRETHLWARRRYSKGENNDKFICEASIERGRNSWCKIYFFFYIFNSNPVMYSKTICRFFPFIMRS